MPALFLILGASVVVGLVVTMMSKTPREKIVDIAMGEVGTNDDVLKYWQSVIPGKAPNLAFYPKEWCGGFVLWAMHQAGVATNVFWKPGEGFLWKYLHQHITDNPQPGDIAYFNKNQHHAIVKSVNGDGTVTLINGNGENGLVTVSHVDINKPAAFYSIQPFIDKVA